MSNDDQNPIPPGNEQTGSKHSRPASSVDPKEGATSPAPVVEPSLAAPSSQAVQADASTPAPLLLRQPDTGPAAALTSADTVLPSQDPGTRATGTTVVGPAFVIPPVAEPAPTEVPPVTEPTPSQPSPADEPPPVQPLPNSVVMDHSRTLWREVEPTDTADPVRHTANDVKSGRSGARLVGASRRGRSHAHDGKYREDDFALAICDDWLLAAVADGTGSKRLARVGARIASVSATRYLALVLRRSSQDMGMAAQLRGAMVGAMVFALAEVSAEAARRHTDMNDLACTLLLLAYLDHPGGKWLGVAQVGDGEITVQQQDGKCGLLGRSDHGKTAGESLFLTSSDTQLTWDSRVRTYEVVEPFRSICIGTDGVMDDFMPPFGKLEDLYHELEEVPRDQAPDLWLLEWLNYARRGSFDDRTLVMLLPGMWTRMQTK